MEQKKNHAIRLFFEGDINIKEIFKFIATVWRRKFLNFN